ncbi:MAG: hypothetical protein CVT48_05745 [Thermoplasmata archaeon HGW-Thermoplasmata-1]|nr:MAG: hypothetical protein CVT48_05745 [Thermoplasmata archaeon HGW-Thermoplasmata-1]
MRIDKTGFVSFVILCLLCAGTVAAYVYHEFAPMPEMTVEDGDTVSVWYVGRFASNGTLFDTNVYESAKQANEEYGFALKARSAYKTLDFTLGKGSMVAGFEDAVNGMKVNETKTVVIAPWEAYGNKTIPFDFDRISEFNVTETIPADQFAYLAQGAEYSVGDVFPHYTNAWNITVVSIDDAGVTFSATDAAEGWRGNIYQWWNSTMTKVDDGVIVVRHDPAVGQKFDARPSYFSPVVTYTVESMNSTNIVISYANSHKLAGEYLQFKITVAEVKKA